MTESFNETDKPLLIGKTILFEPSYKEEQQCICGAVVRHFNKHIKTKMHRLAEEKYGFNSEIKKKKTKSKEDKKVYMREYMRKYNKENKESYEARKEKYKEYRKENRIKCLEQMYDCRYRIKNGERKNFKEE